MSDTQQGPSARELLKEGEARQGGAYASTDDRRGERTLIYDEKSAIERFKTAGDILLNAIGAEEKRTTPSRELSLAKTKVEEAVFWAVKSVTR
jgi:hypothetical protein